MTDLQYSGRRWKNPEFRSGGSANGRQVYCGQYFRGKLSIGPIVRFPERRQARIFSYGAILAGCTSERFHPLLGHLFLFDLFFYDAPIAPDNTIRFCEPGRQCCA